MKAEILGLIDQGVQLNAARFTPCGDQLLAPAFDGTVRRWDLREIAYPCALPLVEGHQAWVTDLAFGRDGRVCSADSWGQIRCWDYRDQRVHWSLADAHDGWIRALAASPDGRTLASCGRDGLVKLFDLESGTFIRALEGHDEDVYQLTFHPSGEELVSGDARGRILHWAIGGKKLRSLDASSMHLLHRLQDVGGVRRLLFDEAGKRLAAAGASPEGGANVRGKPTINLFDFKSGELEQALVTGTKSDVFAHDCVFYGDLLLAACSGQPGQGRLAAHRPGEEKPLFTHNKDLSNCHGVDLHPDGKTIAVVSTNRGSNGNGRRLVNGKYPGNHSPVQLLRLAED